jgi:hypothetical protein
MVTVMGWTTAIGNCALASAHVVAAPKVIGAVLGEATPDA